MCVYVYRQKKKKTKNKNKGRHYFVSSVSKKRLFLSTAARIKKKKEEKGRDLQRALCSGAPKQITVIINEQKKRERHLGTVMLFFSAAKTT